MTILEWRPKESAYDYAYRVLLHNIVNLELAPGSEVSSNKLVDALSVSRMPIREALNELSRIGLVTILPQRGSYIAKIDPQLVQESRFMRLVLEIAVAKLACGGIEERYLEALRDNLAAYRKASDAGNYDYTLELDNEFHRLIFVSVDKSWVYNNLRTQMIHFDRLRKMAIDAFADKSENTLKDHEDILYAITRHDAEMAEMLMTRHLTHYQEDLSSLMQQYPDYFVQRKDKTEQGG